MSKSTLLIITALLLSAASLGFAAFSYINSPKIAYVYNTRILNEYQGMKEGKVLYQKKLQVWQANVDTLEKELNNAIAAYERDFKKMTRKEKELSEQLLQKKQQDFMNYKKAIEEKAQQEDMQMTSSILNQINSYVLEFGKKEGYTYIFGVTDDGNLLYAEEGDNITDLVLNELNKNYSGE